MVVSRKSSVGNARNPVSFITGNEIDLLYSAKSRIYTESVSWELNHYMSMSGKARSKPSLPNSDNSSRSRTT